MRFSAEEIKRLRELAPNNVSGYVRERALAACSYQTQDDRLVAPTVAVWDTWSTERQRSFAIEYLIDALSHSAAPPGQMSPRTTQALTIIQEAFRQPRAVA